MLLPELLEVGFSGDPNSCVNQSLITQSPNKNIVWLAIWATGINTFYRDIWHQSACGRDIKRGSYVIQPSWVLATTQVGSYRQEPALSQPFQSHSKISGRARVSGSIHLTRSQVVQKIKAMQWYGGGKAKKPWGQKKPGCEGESGQAKTEK